MEESWRSLSSPGGAFIASLIWQLPLPNTSPHCIVPIAGQGYALGVWARDDEPRHLALRVLSWRLDATPIVSFESGAPCA